ncbi:MAG: hypothetical protein ACRDH2_12310, partial [Anaerolineales bacterium]
MSGSEFAEALRAALRDLTRPAALHGNPLLRSRLVVARAGPSAEEGARIVALQALLKEAAEALSKTSPREAKLYRAHPGAGRRTARPAFQHVLPPPQG